MSENKIKKNLYILKITSIKQLEENDLDYWHQKRFIEIQKSGQDKDTISKLLIELNNAKENLDQYDLKTLKTKISTYEEQTTKEQYKSKKREKENFGRKDINILYDQKFETTKDSRGFEFKKIEKQWILITIILFFIPIVGIYNGAKYGSNLESEINISKENNIKKRDKNTKVLKNKNILLSKLSCKGCDLENIDLSYENLSNANLRNANLRGADLRFVNLKGADLSDADLSYANLSRTDLSEANLNGADLKYAVLRGADLKNTDLKNSVFYMADLTSASLGGTDLTSATLTRTILKNVDLSNQVLKYQNLQGIKLTGSNLRGINLIGADLTSADLSSAVIENANLKKVNLSSANLKNTNLKNSDLSDSYLDRANIISTNLSDADLRGANLSNAKIYGTNLLNTKLYGAYISGAKISYGTDLFNANLDFKNQKSKRKNYIFKRNKKIYVLVSYYDKISSKSNSWESANNIAKNLGGYLVTINNKEENQWIFSNIGGGYWIGLSYKTDKENLRWVNGEKVKYANWNIKENKEYIKKYSYQMVSEKQYTENDFFYIRKYYPKKEHLKYVYLDKFSGKWNIRLLKPKKLESNNNRRGAIVEIDLEKSLIGNK